MLDVFSASQPVPGVTHTCHLAGSAQRLWEEASGLPNGCTLIPRPPSILLGLQGGPAFTHIARLRGCLPEKRNTEVETGAPVAPWPLPSRAVLLGRVRGSALLVLCRVKDSVHFGLHVPACCLPCSGQDSGRTVPGMGVQGPCRGLSASCSSGLFWNFTGSVDH